MHIHTQNANSSGSSSSVRTGVYKLMFTGTLRKEDKEEIWYFNMSVIDFRSQLSCSHKCKHILKLFLSTMQIYTRKFFLLFLSFFLFLIHIKLKNYFLLIHFSLWAHIFVYPLRARNDDEKGRENWFKINLIYVYL